MVPDPGTCKKPTVLIMASHYQPYPEQVYQRGFRAIVSSIHRNSQSPLSRIKSTNYLESILAKHEARKAEVDEALFLNEKGLLAEASMSNIFLVNNGTLRTPGEENGILPGITREVVLELAASLGIKSMEQKIALKELTQADEAFFTNSLMEIMPLTQLSGQKIGTGEAGAVTQRLAAAYQELVKLLRG